MVNILPIYQFLVNPIVSWESLSDSTRFPGLHRWKTLCQLGGLPSRWPHGRLVEVSIFPSKKVNAIDGENHEKPRFL